MELIEIIAQKKKSPETQNTNLVFENLQKEIADIIGFVPELELAPEHLGGNIAFSCFAAAKETGKIASALAGEFAEKINNNLPQHVAKAEAVGPYINMEPSEKFNGNLISGITDIYGQTNENYGKLAWIEYSSPNMAKPLGVNHIGTTFIGESLAKIYEATGQAVIRHNYIGDWGTPFGKLLYAYQKWHSGEAPTINILKDLYIRFNQEAADDPTMQEEARKIAQQLESGDPELRKLWENFRKLSIQYFDGIYQRLGISFDTWLGESFFTDKMQQVVADAKAGGLAKVDPQTGALVVDLGGNIPTFLLQKGDGTSLYHTRDLAAIKFRADISGADLLLYVVGPEQTLYMRQLFNLAERLGYLKASKPRHISYGMLLMDGVKMSTRKGTSIDLEDLINQSIVKAKEIIREKNKELPEAEVKTTAEIVGTGAIIYNVLRQSRTKNITFDWKKMLDFEQGSAAYLQYTYVRIRSILNKVGNAVSASEYKIEHASEKMLVKKLLFFPVTIKHARHLDSPHIIATYLEELAQLFNTFYGKVSIMNTEDSALQHARLALINAVATTINNGLKLLNIQVPDKM